MSKITQITLVIVFVAIGFASGWGLALWSAEKNINESLPAISKNTPIQNFYGAIKEIKGDTIIIDGPKSPNALENLPEVREVVVGSDTKIIKRTQKDPAVFNVENITYLEDIKNVDPADPTPPVAPSLFNEEILNLNDLRVGDVISVDAGKDVRTQRRFEAATITISMEGVVVNQNISTSSAPSADRSMDPALTPPPQTTLPPPIPPPAQ